MIQPPSLELKVGKKGKVIISRNVPQKEIMRKNQLGSIVGREGRVKEKTGTNDEVSRMLNRSWNGPASLNQQRER